MVLPLARGRATNALHTIPSLYTRCPSCQSDRTRSPAPVHRKVLPSSFRQTDQRSCIPLPNIPFGFPAPILSLALRRSFAASSQTQSGATSTTVASAICSRDHPLYPGQARMVTSIHPTKTSLQTPIAILSPLSAAWSATPGCTAFSQSPGLPDSAPHTPLPTPPFHL